MLENLTKQQRIAISVLELVGIIVVIVMGVKLYKERTTVSNPPLPVSQAVMESPTPEDTSPKEAGVVSPDGNTINTGVDLKPVADSGTKAEVADERTELISSLPIQNANCSIMYDYGELIFTVVVHAPAEKNKAACQNLISTNYPLIPAEEFVYKNE